jgi:putative endonuclease
MTNRYNTVLYTGVTNDIRRRAYEHREKLIEGFTKRYNITKLVYYEFHGEPSSAIAKEKLIKNWSREKKKKLVTAMNPQWKDLYDDVLG